MKDDWARLKSEMEYAEMMKMAKLGRSITKGFTIMAQSNVGVCFCLQLYSNIAGVYPTRRLYFRSYYPYDASSTPVYEITWISQLFVGVIASISYCAVDNFIEFSVLHVCGQFSILKNELEQLPISVKRENVASVNVTRQKLKYIIQRHNHLIKLAIFNFFFLS